MSNSASADIGAAVASPVAARHLDLRYDAAQDRLWLTARSEGAAVDLALTRRLTRLLLGGMLDLLMRTSDAVGRSSAAHRGDVLLFEHLAALDRQPAPPPAAPVAGPESGEAAANRPAPVLVGRVDLSLGADGFSLSFWAATELARLRLPRDQAHLLLDVLVAKTRDAEWDLAELAWMDRRGQFVRAEGALAS